MKTDGCNWNPVHVSRISIFLILISGIIMGVMFPASAVDVFPQTQSWNPYEGWDAEFSSVVGTGLFPTVEVNYTEKPTSEPIPKSTTSDTWVKLAYYPPGTEAGQPAILAGYVGGRNYNAEVTISGRVDVKDEFQKIVTTKAQDNGIFVWAVPDSLEDFKYFQAIAAVSGASVKSNIVATSGLSGYIPVDSDAGTPIVSTTTEPESVSPVITTLTLSADTTRPKVGENVQLSGRLTDDKGKGVSNAKITIEVPDYGTDFLPLTTTKTDGNGEYTATIITKEENIVPVRAVYEGDDTHLASTSNSLTFYAVA